MVLNEAPSKKIQHTWYSRLAQERRELSASVEEAFFSTPSEESFWLDDQTQHTPVVSTEKRDNVFPPRLSLQSRSLPGTSARMGTGLVKTHGKTHTGIWVRFTRGLTAFFAAFRSHSAVADNSVIPPEVGNNMATQSVQVKGGGICPAGGTSDPGGSGVLSAATHAVSSKSERQFVTGTNARQGSLRSTQRPQRLAGRTTRIRLEVVPAPSSASIPNKEKSYLEPKGASYKPFEAGILANNYIPKVSAFQSQNATTKASMTIPDITAFPNKSSTSVRLPAIERVTRRPIADYPFADGDGGTTSIRLPALEKVARRREEPSSVRRAGSGMFECGQRDITISNPSVTVSSVVLVMLTANPGPVVVQYVSLQPRTGFTVHLTDPTTIGVPFNYVVL